MPRRLKASELHRRRGECQAKSDTARSGGLLEHQAGDEVRGLARPAHPVALDAVDAHLAHDPERVGVVHRLGDGRDAQALGGAHDSRDDLAADGAARQVADEAAVDLEDLHRQALQVVEGGVADAEVVQREVTAQRAQVLDKPSRLRHVGEGGGLRHLDDQAGGIGAAFAQRRPEEVEHLVVGEGPAS